MHENIDREMMMAHEQARATFRYFWREVAWDRRRIIPALGMAVVKAPFSDQSPGAGALTAPDVEHMWLADVDFDGATISGVLANSPNELASVREGDAVRLPLAGISDWMYVLDGQVFGGFTVNALRARMDASARDEHDAAWGLDFGDPRQVRVTAYGEHHPMSETMSHSLRDHLAGDPSFLTSRDDLGWTTLHHEALAGSAFTVRVLLEAGADPAARTNDGATALQLAGSLQWDDVTAILRDAEAGPGGRAG